jgi:exodeoxyribonuclease VII small subunit
MAKKTENFDYRAKSEALERIVSELQNPDIQIDDATKLHAEGVKLIAELETYLSQAEIEIQKHVSNS